MSEQEFKPCPFCGQMPKVTKGYGYPDWTKVECQTKDCAPHPWTWTRDDYIVETWNARPVEDMLLADIRAAQDENNSILEAGRQSINRMFEKNSQLIKALNLTWEILHPNRRNWEQPEQVYQRIREEIERLRQENQALVVENSKLDNDLIGARQTIKRLMRQDDTRIYYQAAQEHMHLPWRVEWDRGKALIRNAKGWLLAEFTIGSGDQAKMTVKAVNEYEGTPPADTCLWTPEYSDWTVWNTSCGENWTFEEDGPAENDMHFCPFCGMVLATVKPDPEKEA